MSQNGLMQSGLSQNCLSQNGLSQNGLSQNSLSQKGLVQNSLGKNGFVVYATGDLLRQIFYFQNPDGQKVLFFNPLVEPSFEFWIPTPWLEATIDMHMHVALDELAHMSIPRSMCV